VEEEVQHIEIDQSTIVTCYATDQDNDQLTYTWTKTGGTISGSGSTITWIAPSTTSTYTITCTVSDGELTDEQSISITVTEPETENHSPVIISTAVTSATVGEAYTYDVEATDPDEGDVLAYSPIAAPAGMTINSSTGLINWTPSVIGDYDVIIEVSDGELFTYQEFTVTVQIEVVAASVHNITKGTYYNTIQGALDDADSGNTIEVADGTYDESITFPSGKKIILQSVNGSSSTFIRGNNYSSTVNLNNSLESTTLKGFTVTHADDLIGSGIYIASGNLSIRNCNITDNDFNNYCSGSGIDNEGALTITESIISGNTTYGSGGGIDNYNGIITITASTISSNSAGSGGGISNVGILAITSSIISSNSASISGGGIYNGDLVNVTGSEIFDNSAYSHGGGICNYNEGTLIITESTISGNTTDDADAGGGGSADIGGGGISNCGILTIVTSTISDNTTDDTGGGIETFDDGTLTITGSTISANSADYASGGLHLHNSWGSITIGGESSTDKNTICGNYKTGEDPSLDQQIGDDSGSLYDTYKGTNYISVYCE